MFLVYGLAEGFQFSLSILFLITFKTWGFSVITFIINNYKEYLENGKFNVNFEIGSTKKRRNLQKNWQPFTTQKSISWQNR